MTVETASIPHHGDPQAKQAVDDLLSAFEAFKQANDQRLDEIEARQSADVLLEEKVNRINAKMSELNGMAQRPALSRAGVDDAGLADIKAAFDSYIRKGEASPEFESKVEADALNSTEGAVLLPDHVELQLNDLIGAASPLARLAGKRTLVSGNTLSVIAHQAEATAQWVAEAASRTTTSAPTIRQIDIVLAELYANPAVTQRFFDDADIDVEGWLLNSMAQSFADKENAAFISGTGTNQPTGILSEPHSLNATDTDKVLYIKTGDATGLPTANAANVLLSVLFALSDKYRSRGAWLMNAKAQADIRGIKDSNMNYIWSPPAVGGTPPTLYGYPVFDEANMPDMTANNVPIVFGDFERCYTIARKQSTRLIRDPYSAKPLVQFYATRHVGGRVVDPKALIGLQVKR